MKFNKTLIALLAIFMIVLSAGMVSAEDAADDGAESQDVGDVEETDFGDEETTGDDAPETGDVANETDDESNETNEFEENMQQGSVIDAATYNQTNDSASDFVESTPVKDTHATGNPLWVLLVAVAGIGVSSLRRRK